jgi:ATP-dependent exoDNAse (exonuclease V) alpha subunit
MRREQSKVMVQSIAYTKARTCSNQAALISPLFDCVSTYLLNQDIAVRAKKGEQKQEIISPPPIAIQENIPSILIKDLKVYVEPYNKNNIECNNELSVFRVKYRFLLDAKCDDGKTIIEVKSNKQLWELNEGRENKDYAMIMK